MRKSFTTRVFLLNFVVLALPMLIDAVILFSRFYSESIDLARKQLVEIADFKAETVKQLAPVPQNFLKDMIFFMNLSENMTPSTLKVFENLLKRGSFEDIYFVLLSTEKKQGNYKVITSTLKADEEKFQANSFFVERVLRNYSDAELRFIETNQDGVQLVFAQGQLIQSNEVPVGILIAGVHRTKFLSEILSNPSNKEIDFALLNDHNIVMASSLPNLPGNYFGTLRAEEKKIYETSSEIGSLKLAEKPITLTRKLDGYIDFEFEDINYLAYAVKAPERGLSIVAFASEKKYLTEALKHLITFSIILIIVIIIGIILAYFLALWVSRPLRQLSYVMGDLTQRFNPQPFGYEINIIGTLYNETLEALLTNIKHAEDEHVKREKYEKEVELGRDVQESLLSLELPQIEGVHAAAFYLPAKDAGGDFFCLEQKKDKRLWLAVGDASGKGISSCLYALTARSLMRTYAEIYNQVETICAKTNDDFLKDVGDTGMFVTSLMGIYSPETKIFSYYSCGHVPGLVRRSDGTLVELSHSGMALGLLEARGYQSDQIQLSQGDLVLFYTKGLSEGVNKRNQFFSLRRIKELFQHRKWETAQEVVNGLISEFEQFTSDVERENEVVIVALEIV